MSSSRTARLLTESLRAEASPAGGKTVKFTRRWLILTAIVSLILVALAGFWSSHAVMESVEDLLTANLEANLNVSVTALTAWIESELALVRFWAEDEQLRDLVEGRLRSGPGDGDLEELQKLLSSGYTAKEVKDWAIFDREGNFIFLDSDNTDQGRSTAAAMKRYHEKVMQGQSVFVPPIRLSKLVEGLDDAEEMFIVMAAPVRDREGTVIAALLFCGPPDGTFSRILQASRMGESGDTYAFDRDGLLISSSRFEKELLTLGLAQGRAGPRSIPSALIRDPGGDLSAGFKPTAPPDAWPPTRMLASAQQGESGIDLSGYRDIRGITVAGAWRWLPEFDFGIAIEVAHEKIKGITRPIRLAVQGLMGLLIVLAGLILFSTIWVSRLQKNIEEIKQVGHYTIEEKLGEGGMGKVFRAHHALLKRPTAIKFLKPDALSTDSLERFEREVQITSRLTHPNTVDVYDFGRTPEGVFYYAMEYLPGISLSDLLSLDGAIPPARAIHILRHICFSLEEAHGMGLIHRDIKPPNVILCERGGQYDSVKVLDFGLVKDIKNQDVQMTAMHEVAGTPAYVAPERLTDPSKVDHRADIYSLGSVAFNLLTGEDVFDGNTAFEICYHVMKTPPPQVSAKATQPIPEALDQLIADCLAKDPNDRPVNVTRIIAALDEIEIPMPWDQDTARKWWQANADRIRKLNAGAA
jgi:tRNA A-37 threonylcarbamoyl transferase component Bud32